jgi:hypothetical protein
MKLCNRALIRLLVPVTIAALATPAFAGQTRFGWLHDTDTVPQRGVELENWFVEQDGEKGYAAGPSQDETLIWWGPVVGITDRLELALPLELSVSGPETNLAVSVERFGPEARLRLTDPDPLESGPFSGLLRFGAKRMLAEHDGIHLEGGAVLSADQNRFHMVVDLEGVAEIAAKSTTFSLRPGAGISARVAGDFRLGAEVYASLAIREADAISWAALGPNLAWSYGRLWLSASFPIGLWHIGFAPRLNWAVAL